jgi:hypothetical protein
MHYLDYLKIQEGEVLALLSESEFSMHTALIFKEQMKVQGLREKGLAQPHYSMQHIEGYGLLCFKDKYTFLSPKDKKYSPGIMNTCFIRDRLVWNRLSETP